MPEKLDRCVQELMKKGHSESEAWAICKKALKMRYEKAKRIFTGQLINKAYLDRKAKEFDLENKE